MRLALAILFLCVTGCASPNESAPDEGVPPAWPGSFQLVDLTYSLNEATPYWPGPRNQPFHWAPFATIASDQVFEGRFSMDEHAGTHIDAPNHFIADQVSVDELPLEHLLAPAAVIDVRDKVAADPDYRLSTSDIAGWELTNGGPIPRGAVVFMLSGWGERWADFERYKNTDASGVLHFPGFSAEAAEWLLEERAIAGLGIDALSVDAGTAHDFPVHQLTHGRGKYNLENVANLSLLPSAGAYVIVAPLKIEKGSGAPVRLLGLTMSPTTLSP